MADYGSIPSPTNKNRKPTSSIFSSPRLFTAFGSKGLCDTESLRSPTSILDSKPFSPTLRNPFWSDTQTQKTRKPENRTHWDRLDSRGVGLGIVDALVDDKSDPKPETRMVLFGSQLKIQIPPLPPPPLSPSVLSPTESPNSPADFGIKTRNSQLGSFSSGISPMSAKKSQNIFGLETQNSEFLGAETQISSGIFAGCLSASEMELSEDYTRVICYGPNPRTTHIFDNCVVESGFGFSAVCKENGFYGNRSVSYPSESFLSFCYNCKKNLGQGKDIYIYRGEKAFCSSECRHQEMMLEEEEGEEKLECDDRVYGASSLS
ncbi:hypothetical protein U1Q18_031238 [Sarracenia purpurea var. burkii]